MPPDAGFYYVVRLQDERLVQEALRPLQAFLATPGGRVRLEGSDRVIVWQDGRDLYVSPGAVSLASYLSFGPAPPAGLYGPEITPSRNYGQTPLIPDGRIAASELPPSSVLVLGRA